MSVAAGHTDRSGLGSVLRDLVKPGDENLREMNKKLQNMLEEQLTKNMHLHKASVAYQSTPLSLQPHSPWVICQSPLHTPHSPSTPSPSSSHPPVNLLTILAPTHSSIHTHIQPLSHQPTYYLSICPATRLIICPCLCTHLLFFFFKYLAAPDLCGTWDL